jgi:hypothetical protein
MNRARQEHESYEQYHANLKAAEMEFRARLRGVYVTACAYPRWRARNDINEKGPEFRERVRAAQRGYARRVQSHRKMGG